MWALVITRVQRTSIIAIYGIGLWIRLLIHYLLINLSGTHVGSSNSMAHNLSASYTNHGQLISFGMFRCGYLLQFSISISDLQSMQSMLPSPEGKPFGFILYADQTKLSSFGSQQGYPIVARIANLPLEIRNGKGLGGGCVIGLLPIVSWSIASCLLLFNVIRSKRTRKIRKNPRSRTSNVLSGTNLFWSFWKQLSITHRQVFGSSVVMLLNAFSSHSF